MPARGVEQHSYEALMMSDDNVEDQFADYPRLEKVNDAVAKKVRMPRFKLKSDKRGTKKKANAVERNINDMLNYLDIDDKPFGSEETMYAVGEPWSDSGGNWVKVASVVDSGAAEHVASRKMAPRVRITQSAGSRRGQTHVAANGESMATEGNRR